MYRTSRFIVPMLACMLAAACASGPERRDDPSVMALTRLLVGEFNNHAQIWSARRLDEPLPPFAEVVVQRLPEAPREGAEALLYRQYDGEGRLYREARFLLEGAEGGVSQTVQVRKGNDWQTLDGCRVHWRREGSGFVGSTRGDGCRFEQRNSGRTVVFERTWGAAPERLVLEETTRRAGNSETHTYRFARLRYFGGWAGVLAQGPASESNDEWRIDRDMRLHDGGDTARIRDAQGDTAYAVRLERLVWPRSGTPMLRLSVLEADSGSLIAYSWTAPEAERIGINLGWLQAGLSAGGEGAE